MTSPRQGSLFIEPCRVYGSRLQFDLPDLRDADDWDDAFGYGDVWVRDYGTPEINVLVHVIAPGAGRDHAENTGWMPL